MKLSLYWGGASPFVRKVMVVAHELGLEETIEIRPTNAHPIDRDSSIQAVNPLAKVPSARTEGGLDLYDSRVICEYLDALVGGGIFPAPGPERWSALRQQALADGLLDAALLVRYETLVRPEMLRWQVWTQKQKEKMFDALNAMEADTPAPRAVDIGTIACACALGWLDFRFPNIPWRENRPALAEWFGAFEARPAMIATRPKA